MGTGAEGEAGVEVEGDPSRRDGLIPHPLGHHIEPGTDFQWFIVFLPAVGPVVFSQGDGGILLIQAPGELFQLFAAVFVVGDVELYPCDPLHSVQQFLVHIVPILPVLLQKMEKILFILNDQAVHSCGG